jgi:hypothetical protein
VKDLSGRPREKRDPSGRKIQRAAFEDDREGNGFRQGRETLLGEESIQGRRIMKRLLFCLLILCTSIPATAQYLPLILDQTIQLPDTSSVWDVMPHPDGYFVWVQAISTDSSSFTISSGNTRGELYGTLSFTSSTPQSTTLFLHEANEPYLLVGHVLPADSGIVLNIFRLSDGSPRYPTWTIRTYHHALPGGEEYISGLVVTLAVGNPAPPRSSSRLPVFIGYYQAAYQSGGGFSGGGAGKRVYYLPNLLQNDSCQMSTIRYVQNVSEASLDSAVWFAFDGAESGWAYFPPRYSHFREICIFAGREVADTISTLAIRCLESDSDSYSTVAATYVANIQAMIAFGRIGGVCYALATNNQSNWSWTIQDTFSFAIAADVVPGNNREEFLAFNSLSSRFSILDPLDGHSLGMSDSIHMSSNPRLIGRYDSTFRRLVFRDGQQLKLYRFGTYLATDERNAMLPSSLALSCYPNPFNPSTTISFALEHETNIRLNIFDLTGRRVRTLAEGRWNAGMHEVRFDGAALPSGLYFARLQAGGLAKTQKLVMLK